MQALRIDIIFNKLIFESLMFHCCFIDDSVMILWRKIHGTLMISMEKLKIINVYTVFYSKTSMCQVIKNSSITEV